MTPQEIEFWKDAIEEIGKAWIIGCIILSCGIGSISIKNIIGKGER